MTRPGIPLPGREWQHGYQNVLRPEELPHDKSAEPGIRTDTFGGPDSGSEDELAGPAAPPDPTPSAGRTPAPKTNSRGPAAPDPTPSAADGPKTKARQRRTNDAPGAKTPG